MYTRITSHSKGIVFDTFDRIIKVALLLALNEVLSVADAKANAESTRPQPQNSCRTVATLETP